MKLKKLISSILPAVFILLFSLNAFSFNESDKSEINISTKTDLAAEYRDEKPPIDKSDETEHKESESHGDKFISDE